MAVIGKIQKNSLLLLIVIGVAMLAFIFTDFLKGGGGDIEQLPTATISGEPIDQTAYQELRDGYVNRSKNDLASQGQEWTDAAQKSAEDNAFNEIVRRAILGAEFEKLGIECTTDELNDMIHGNHVHPWVMQIPIFNGDAGFSKDSVRNFINRLNEEPLDATEAERSNWLESRKQWKEFENELKDARKADKYVTLIKKGIYVNKLEAENQYASLYDKKTVRFVVQRYADIPKEEVTVTDEEIKAYFDAHKNDAEYEQEEARDIQMVTFDIVPSEEDRKEDKLLLEGIKESFKLAANDIGFVYQNTDNKEYLTDSASFKYGNDEFLTYTPQGGTYPRSADELMQSAEIGDVVGPFETQANEFVIGKITAVPTENQAWVRHILISAGATRTEEEAKAISDSLIRVIKTEDNFAELVPQVSDDPGSKNNGGEYKWFAEGVMVPAFNDAAFNGAIGQIQLVKTSYGYHIVEVLGQAVRKTPTMAIVTKKIKPSDNTLRLVEERAYDFIYNVSEMTGDSAFNKVAADSNMVTRSAKVFLSNDFVLGMTKSKRMLSFAFRSDIQVGDLSDPILDGNKYVVGVVDNLIKEGTPEFDDIKEVMRRPALMDKQADIYAEKMANKESLEDVVAVMTKGSVRTQEVTFDSKAVFPGGQPEPSVVGKLFTNIPVGSMTAPIKGEEGVYVFIVDNETPADETTDLTTVISPLQLKRASTADTRVIQALREKANLVDNRRKIEYQ